MKNHEQSEALSLLAEVWSLAPDVRFGQLLAHLGFLGEAHIGRGLAYLDDDQFIALLHRHRAELIARLSRPSAPAPEHGISTLSVSGSPTDAMPAHHSEG